MRRWGKLIKAVCQESHEGLYIIEADENLRWYGAQLLDVCNEKLDSLSDSEIYRKIKGKVVRELKGGNYIAFVSPTNLQVDIYTSQKRMFVSNYSMSRPFCVTREGFRLGFFEDKEEAVDFFLKVSKILKEEGVTLHLFY